MSAKFISNLLADSVCVNPVVVRNVHAVLGGKLDEAGQARLGDAAGYCR